MDSVHQRNLSRIVRHIRDSGPTSRAGLTAATGLNRSTIGALVGELVAAGLAAEGPPDATRRVGRPSPIVRLCADVAVIAANPEVDSIDVAAIALDGRILIRERVATDDVPSPAAATQTLADVIARWRSGPLAGVRVVAIGLAVPGLVRASDGLVRLAPHLGWREVPIAELVTAGTGLATRVGNDATLGALAEHRFGAGMGTEDIVYLNGGPSGIGGGAILGGRLVTGRAGYAGEFGHNRPGIESGRDQVVPGGVVEDEVNRARLVAVTGLRRPSDADLHAVLAASADAGVRDELTRQRRILAIALAGAVNILNPSLIILGGFLAIIADADPGALAREVARHCLPAAFDGTEIVAAGLGEDRLLIGAAELAFETLIADPLS